MERYFLRRIWELHKRKAKVWLNQSTNLTVLRQFDIEDSLGFRWEIKLDQLSHKTGNVYIEHSAVLNSLSDFFIYCLPTYVVISREQLLAIIKEYPVVRGGDFNSPGTLVPNEIFKRLGTNFDEFQIQSRGQPPSTADDIEVLRGRPDHQSRGSVVEPLAPASD